jgi:hypothetical protein
VPVALAPGWRRRLLTTCVEAERRVFVAKQQHVDKDTVDRSVPGEHVRHQGVLSHRDGVLKPWYYTNSRGILRTRRTRKPGRSFRYGDDIREEGLSV